MMERILKQANEFKLVDEITQGDIIALVYKYWWAECSEQELHEDLSYLVEWDAIDEIIYEIREMNPDNFLGELLKAFNDYCEEIQND